MPTNELLMGRIISRKKIIEDYDVSWEMRMQKLGDGSRMYKRHFAGVRDVIGDYLALCKAVSNGRPNLAEHVRSVASLTKSFVDLYRPINPYEVIFIVYYIGSYAQVTRAKGILGQTFIKVEPPENLDAILQGNEPNLDILSGTAEGFRKYLDALSKNHKLQQHEVIEALKELMHQPAN